MNTPKPGRPPLPSRDRATAQIQLRVTTRRKSAYVRAAAKLKQTLASWAFTHLDKASGHSEPSK